MKMIFLYPAIALISLGSLPAQDTPARTTDDNKALAMQGEYTGRGEIEILNAKLEVQIGLQVVALGDDQFSGKLSMTGLPSRAGNYAPADLGIGQMENDVLVFANKENSTDQIHIRDGVARIKSAEWNVELKRVLRKSETLGIAPPADAIVLFGAGGDKADMVAKHATQWLSNRPSAPIDESGYLMEGVTSRKRFGSHRIHVEFQLPFQPKARGQGRGNSGLYMQGRYEIQMLDSFGLDGKINECGAIYGIKKPDINMCFPPTQWQTYDIEFHAAKFEGTKKVSDARMTVRHNGVLIHNNVKIPKSTTASPFKESPEDGPVYFQNHGNPVRYRNIWVQPID